MGLRVSSVSDEWQTCGLEDGDILRSIQGVQLRSPRTLSQLYQEHQYQEEIQFERIRNKEREVVRIRILDAQEQKK